VTLLALGAELESIPIVLATDPVTIEALGWCSLIRALLLVARCAADVAMTPVERKRRFIVERAARGFELRRRRGRPAQRSRRDHKDHAPDTPARQAAHGL
jgi:hypothetical protein